MFGLNELKNTRFYQEVKEEGRAEGTAEGRAEGKAEGKLESIPRMLCLGLSPDVIARSLDLPLEIVRQEAEKLRESS